MIPLFRPVLAPPREVGDRIAEVVASRYTGEGAVCRQLEDRLAELLGYRVLLTNSGTSALKLAFVGSGVRGGEVIVSPVTCIATIAAAVDAGASIVWADVDPTTGNIDPEDAARKVTARTAAICGVDWAGRVCDFGAIRRLVRGVALVEDAAHAFLVGRPPVERGDWICHSFQSIKQFGMADGGAVAAPGEAALHDAREDRWFGLDRTRGDSMRCYQRVRRLGYKMQSNDVLAALGLANLPYGVEAVRRCQEAARRYAEVVSTLRYVRAPQHDHNASYWMYTVLVSRPVVFEEFMRDHGVEVGQVHSRCDIHPCFAGSRFALELPGVETFMAHQSNLPTMPHLSDADLSVVLSALKRWDQDDRARW